MDYRYKETLSVFKPEKPEDVTRGLNECCCEMDIFASTTSSDEWKNDTTLAFYKKAVSTDTCSFVMTKCGTTSPLTNLGTDAEFPNDSLAVGFMYNWNEILTTYGVGEYKITLNYTKAGVSYTKVWGVYTLQEWSMERVQKLVRFRTLFKSYNQQKDIDFTGSNCFDTIRIPGWFGQRDRQPEVNQLITKGYVSEKVTRKNDNLYTFSSDLIPECLSEKLLDLHMIDEDEMYVSEHWKYSHTYKYIDFPVVFRELTENQYFAKDRRASFTLTFGDRVKNDNSLYNNGI